MLSKSCVYKLSYNYITATQCILWQSQSFFYNLLFVHLPIPFAKLWTEINTNLKCLFLDVNECLSNNPCSNNGRCVNTDGGYYCNCMGTGFEGDKCLIGRFLYTVKPCLNWTSLWPTYVFRIHKYMIYTG